MRRFKILILILFLMLFACVTPTALMKGQPDFKRSAPGRYDDLAHCALRALEEHYAVAWSYDLREHSGENRIELIIRAFGTDTVMVAEFRAMGAGDETQVTIWQTATLYNPKKVLWESLEHCHSRF